MSGAPHPAPAGHPTGEMSMAEKRNKRLYPIGAGLLIAGVLGYGHYDNIQEPREEDQTEEAGSYPRVNLRDEKARSSTALQNRASECQGAKKYALDEALRLRDTMVTTPAVQAILEGGAGELKKPSETICPPAEGRYEAKTVPVWVVKDGTFAYGEDFFKTTGQPGKCGRASEELAIEVCERWGGCTEGELSAKSYQAKQAGYSACMEWTL